MIEIQPIITFPVKKTAKIFRDERQSSKKQEKPQEEKHDEDQSEKHIDEIV